MQPAVHAVQFLLFVLFICFSGCTRSGLSCQRALQVLVLLLLILLCTARLKWLVLFIPAGLSFRSRTPVSANYTEKTTAGKIKDTVSVSVSVSLDRECAVQKHHHLRVSQPCCTTGARHQTSGRTRTFSSVAVAQLARNYTSHAVSTHAWRLARDTPQAPDTSHIAHAHV